MICEIGRDCLGLPRGINEHRRLVVVCSACLQSMDVVYDLERGDNPVHLVEMGIEVAIALEYSGLGEEPKEY